MLVYFVLAFVDVVDCLLFDVCCLLFDVVGLLFAVCCLLFLS